MVSVAFDFTYYLIALPIEPIRNVFKLCISVICTQPAVFCQLVAFFTVLAGKFYSFSEHFAFRIAIGAAVKDTVKTICSEGLVNNGVRFVLIFEIIKRKCIIYYFNESI
jgi:hypothetical protein